MRKPIRKSHTKGEEKKDGKERREDIAKQKRASGSKGGEQEYATDVKRAKKIEAARDARPNKRWGTKGGRGGGTSLATPNGKGACTGRREKRAACEEKR